MDATEKERARIAQQVDDRTEKVWQYVRRYQNSLCRETHTARIRELVETPLPIFAYQLRAANADLEASRRLSERRLEENRRLRQQVRELRDGALPRQRSVAS